MQKSFAATSPLASAVEPRTMAKAVRDDWRRADPPARASLFAGLNLNLGDGDAVVGLDGAAITVRQVDRSAASERAELGRAAAIAQHAARAQRHAADRVAAHEVALRAVGRSGAVAQGGEVLDVDALAAVVVFEATGVDQFKARQRVDAAVGVAAEVEAEQAHVGRPVELIDGDTIGPVLALRAAEEAERRHHAEIVGRAGIGEVDAVSFTVHRADAVEVTLEDRAHDGESGVAADTLEPKRA